MVRQNSKKTQMNSKTVNLVHEMVEKLVKQYAPQKVVLFGSYAYGRAHSDSDIDLLIIKETSERFIERWVTVRRILSDPQRKVGLDILVLTPREISERIDRGDQFVEEIVKKGKVFYELGSGDGRVVIEAAKLGAKANGIEQSWLRVWYSRYKSRIAGTNKETHFCHGNVFDRTYYPADVVYIYLLKPAVERLEAKLKKELNKGAIVITQTYHFKNWKPFKTMGTKSSDFRLGGDYQLYRV